MGELSARVVQLQAHNQALAAKVEEVEADRSKLHAQVLLLQHPWRWMNGMSSDQLIGPDSNALVQMEKCRASHVRDMGVQDLCLRVRHRVQHACMCLRYRAQ